MDILLANMDMHESTLFERGFVLLVVLAFVLGYLLMQVIADIFSKFLPALFSELPFLFLNRP